MCSRRCRWPTRGARCPHAVFLAPRFPEYERFSAQVMEIFRSITPLVEPLSLDEAFLDVIGARRRLGDGPTIAALDTRQRIRDETGLVASVGVATTKFLAKIASDLSKPDGLLVVEPGGEDAFLHPLPLGRLWGVGPATLARLESLGVRTVGDVARAARGRRSWPRWARRTARISRSSRATSTSATSRPSARPSRSATRRRSPPTCANAPSSSARSCGSPIASPVGCARAGVEARTLTLKVRFADFRTITRSRTEPEATALSTDIAATARALLAAVDVVGRCPVARHLRLAARALRRRARVSSISEATRPTSTTRSAPSAARSRMRWTRFGPASERARSAPVRCSARHWQDGRASEDRRSSAAGTSAPCTPTR